MVIWSRDLTPAPHTTRLKALAAGPKGGEEGRGTDEDAEERLTW